MEKKGPERPKQLRREKESPERTYLYDCEEIQNLTRSLLTMSANLVDQFEDTLFLEKLELKEKEHLPPLYLRVGELARELKTLADAACFMNHVFIYELMLNTERYYKAEAEKMKGQKEET